MFYIFNIYFNILSGGQGGGGGVGGDVEGGSEHNVQMFPMALQLFKKYKCAKLF